MQVSPDRASKLSVACEDPQQPDATRLLAALSAELEMITGSSGKSSFDLADMRDGRACFVLARDAQGVAVGCGALRPLTAEVAELKRMYAAPRTRAGACKESGRGAGVGSAVLACLEAQARQLGYSAIWLETRRANAAAVAFYTARAYVERPNYGKYAGNPLAICFEKLLQG